MKKIFLLLLLCASPSFAQFWNNDTLTQGWWHGSPIDTDYLNMLELRTVFTGGSGFLQASNNLSDVANANTSLNNLLPTQTSNANKFLKTNGTNTSWATASSAITISITSAIQDLTSPASWLVKDTLNTANTLIHATSKPTVPQFYYVVKAADVPTNTNILNYMAVISIGGKNRNTASAVTVNWMGCRNTNTATEFTASSSSVSVTSLNFWYTALWYNSVKVNVGDTLGIKLWSSVADTTDVRYADIYFIPRQITGGSNYQYFYGQTNNSTNVPWDDGSVFHGAVSGVAYANMSGQPNATFLDSATSSSILLMNMNNTMPQVLFTVSANQYISFASSGGANPTDVNAGFGIGNAAAATLYQFPASNGGARRIKYLRKITYGVN